MSSTTLGQNRRGELRRKYPKEGKTKRLQAACFQLATGITLIMMTAFMGLMVGGGIGLIIVGVAWIGTAGRELRGATGKGDAGTQPGNAKAGAAARTCDLCDAQIPGERTDHRCPLIEAFAFVRSEAIKLDDRGVKAEGDAEPGMGGLRQDMAGPG